MGTTIGEMSTLHPTATNLKHVALHRALLKSQNRATAETTERNREKKT